LRLSLLAQRKGHLLFGVIIGVSVAGVVRHGRVAKMAEIETKKNFEKSEISRFFG
jgi:CRISPR/Cas system CMR subunit Cmr4 (Cas7 group RAMP superfamily)